MAGRKRVPGWLLTHARTFRPRRVIAVVGTAGLVVSTFQVLVATLVLLDGGRLAVRLASRWGGGALLGDVAPGPQLAAALVQVVAAVAWILLVAVAKRPTLRHVVALPVGAVLLAGATTASQLALEDVPALHVGGSVLNTVLAVLLVGAVTLGSWVSLREIEPGEPLPARAPARAPGR